MNILPFPAKFQPSPKLAIIILDSFVVTVLTSIPPQRAPLPPTSFTPNSIYNLPKSEITRLQLIQNSLARGVAKAPKSCHITPILPVLIRSLHWLKITERIEYKLFSHLQSPHSSQPPILRMFTTSLFNLLAALALHLWLPSLVHLVSGINCLVLSVNLIPVSLSVLPVHAPTTFSHSVNSPLSPSITPFLFHPRLKTYLFHKSFPPTI